jgi:hypothetical protein
MAGPLAMGLGAVCVASLGSLVLPAASAAGGILYNVSLYGGLGLFSAFVLYDTNKIVSNAHRKQVPRSSLRVRARRVVWLCAGVGGGGFVRGAPSHTHGNPPSPRSPFLLFLTPPMCAPPGLRPHH